MGYFSNGTEGEMYEEEYCVKCVHSGDDGCGCPVLNLHMRWNYEQFKDDEKKHILDTFIPREGIENKQCVMYTTKE